MKKVCLFLIFLALNCPLSCAAVLQGGISMDVTGARDAAFENVGPNLSKELILANFIDPNYEANRIALLNGQIDLKDRELCQFSSGIYGVRYNNDPYRAYYYTKDGRLDYTGKKSRLEYPHNVATYDLRGNLIGSAYYVSKFEQYIFDKDKNLTTHWVGNTGYDKNGNVKASRRYFE